MTHKSQFGPWTVEFSPEDGGRLDRLAYEDIELLTVQPIRFHAPQTDYGEYETRPVYGYDDCFPSVEECEFPGTDWKIPDHGEVCWLPWEVKEERNRLIFSVKSRKLPVKLSREMNFERDGLLWSFTVENFGEKMIPFQHVMHPLMPLKNITNINLPEFESVYDAINNKVLDLNKPEQVVQFLLSRPTGTTHMLFLRNVNEGSMSWQYLNRLQVDGGFSKDFFPSVGIWWNNDKYPGENGCRRNECAFEPVPGMNSVLSDAYAAGKSLKVDPGENFNWQIIWKINL
jgi:hypothetical protein